MSGLEDEFKSASTRVRALPNQPNENLLKLYALFKQATEGDVQGKRPGIFDLKGRAKFDAWTSEKSKSRETAMKEYVEFVISLEKTV